MSAATQLRQLFDHDTSVVAPGASDPLTARLVQDAGFPAVYLTGFGATAVRLGTPDIGLLTQTEMADHARNMTRAVSIPVIADADNGYGGPSNIERTVDEYIRADVAALHLEDQLSPKRCGQMAGIHLMEAQSGAQHIRAAVEARGDRDLVIIGRTDALGVVGMDEAISRARLYRDAGADLTFIDGVKTIADAETISARLPGPKVLAVITGHETEKLTVADLGELGFTLVLYPLDALFASTRAAADALAQLRETGISNASGQLSYDEFTRYVGLGHHQRLDDSYGS